MANSILALFTLLSFVGVLCEKVLAYDAKNEMNFLQTSHQSREACAVSVCFAFDESSSVTETMFQNGKLAAIGIASHFQNPSTYSAVQYSESSSIIQSPTNDLGLWITAVQGNTQDSGDTDTKEGLEKCANLLDDAAFPRVIVLFTSGVDALSDHVSAQAAQVKGLGITLVIVNLRHASMLPVLQNMATQASLAVHFSDWEQLVASGGPIKSQVCENCCKQSHVCYALDESGSISTSDFNAVTDILISVTSAHAMFASTSTYSAVEYSDEASILSSQTSGPMMMSVLEENQKGTGSTKGSFALQLCSKLLSQMSGTKTIVLVTDGHDYGSDLENTATSLKTTIGIVTIGVGSYVDGITLGNVASPNAYVQLNTFPYKFEAIGPIVNAICKSRTVRSVAASIPFPAVGCHPIVCVLCGGVWTCYIRSGNPAFDEQVCVQSRKYLTVAAGGCGVSQRRGELKCVQGRTFGVWGGRQDSAVCRDVYTGLSASKRSVKPRSFVVLTACVSEKGEVSFKCSRRACRASSPKCWPTVV